MQYNRLFKITYLFYTQLDAYRRVVGDRVDPYLSIFEYPENYASMVVPKPSRAYKPRVMQCGTRAFWNMIICLHPIILDTPQMRLYSTCIHGNWRRRVSVSTKKKEV